MVVGSITATMATAMSLVLDENLEKKRLGIPATFYTTRPGLTHTNPDLHVKNCKRDLTHVKLIERDIFLHVFHKTLMIE
jgi:hypothetical protein